MSTRIFFAWALLASIQASLIAFAADDSRKMNGRIESLNDQSIVVRSGKDRLEIPRKDVEIPDTAKAGDSVTLWYKLDVERVEVRRRKQEAGKIAPDVKKPIDDRAFYPAKNQATPSQPFGEGSRAVNHPTGM